MKLLAKIGLGGLLGTTALFVSVSIAAPKDQAQADLAEIQKLHAVATSQNDRIKLNCLNEKLLEAKALMNIIEAGDESRAGEVHELRVAAEACVGQKQVTLEGNNTYTAPPGAAEPSDPGDWDWGSTFEPPLNASPSMPTSQRR